MTGATHATVAFGAGGHHKVVSERLGHANVSITLDLSNHVTERCRPRRPSASPTSCSAVSDGGLQNVAGTPSVMVAGVRTCRSTQVKREAGMGPQLKASHRRGWRPFALASLAAGITTVVGAQPAAAAQGSFEASGTGQQTFTTSSSQTVSCGLAWRTTKYHPDEVDPDYLVTASLEVNGPAPCFDNTMAILIRHVDSDGDEIWSQGGSSDARTANAAVGFVGTVIDVRFSARFCDSAECTWAHTYTAPK